MPDIQEETTKEIFATIKEGVQFGVKELKEALEWILASLSKQKEQIAGHYNRHEDRQEYRHEDEFRSNKVSMKELAETGGALDKTTIFDHDKLFDGGYISFSDEGNIIISSSLSDNDRIFTNVRKEMRIQVNDKMKEYLSYHKNNEFRQ